MPKTKKKRVKNGRAKYYVVGDVILVVKNYKIVTVKPRSWVK